MAVRACMIFGRKITSIFGFGIIEDFTDTVSCLEQKSPSISTVLPKLCTQHVTYFRAPNKNIGSAFMAWKTVTDLSQTSGPQRPTPRRGKAAVKRKIEFAKRKDMTRSWPQLGGENLPGPCLRWSSLTAHSCHSSNENGRCPCQ